MDIPNELADQIARGNGVLFVGAGLSMGAGLPGWSQLLTPLADSINLPSHQRADLLKVAQYYELKRRRHALISHIQAQTDATGRKPTDNHCRLARLGIRTWVTTNYDDLLEQTLRESNEDFRKVVRDKDLPYTSADAVTLVKLHGDREQPDTIIITRQDYDTYSNRFPRVKDKLASLLMEKTFLFVGYGINDPDFNQIHAGITFDLQKHQRMAYAVLFDCDEFTLSDLHSRNIHVLNIQTGGQANYSERLGALLDDLIHQVDQTREQKAQVARPFVAAPKRIYHNLDYPDYARFVGREQEVSTLISELRPPPEGPWRVINVHGIGGVGKTALVQEVVWRLVRGHQSLQPSDRFDAVVWATAKEEALRTPGIRPRGDYFRSVSDVFDTIASTLGCPGIVAADLERKETLVRELLSNQRTLIVLDNLEAIDDPKLEIFSCEPPYPSKVLITSRHRLEGLPGLSLRLPGMTREECFTLIEQECRREEQNRVFITKPQTEELFKCTGGIPLAVVWGIGLARGGRNIELVLQRLTESDSDIAHFCFDYSMSVLRQDQVAHSLLMALSLFPTEVSRLILGIVTGFDQDQVALVEALSKLERFSIVSRQGDGYSVLPLARTYVLAEAQKYPDFQESVLNRWQLGKDAELSRIDKLWSQAAHAVADETHGHFESICHELAQSLGIAWGMPIIDETPYQSARVLGFSIETKSVFSGTHLPIEMPLVFLKDTSLTDQAIEEILVLREQFFLLVPFFEGQKLHNAVLGIEKELRRKYALDVIVLARHDVLRSIAAQDPQRVLRKIVLTQVDLVRVAPFVITGPTATHTFFGREQELHEIAERIATTSYAVLGGRRIGKTSLLNYLYRYLLPSAGFRAIYHDCSSTPTYDAFRATSIRDWQPQPPPDALTTFNDLLQSPPSDKPLVLLLDEADKLVPADRVNGWPLFNTLRALANSRRAQIVLSGERTLRRALHDPTSPLFNFAHEMLLGPLDYHAVEELVIQPMKQLEIVLVDEVAVVRRIYDFTAGHPNVVQRLCRRLIGRLNEQGTRQITLEDVNAVIEDSHFQETDFLQTYWEAASPLEKIITLVLSHDTRVCGLRGVRQLLFEQAHIQPSATATKEALDWLVDLRSILKRSQDGYTFAVEAFPAVLANTTTAEDLLEVLVEQYKQWEEQT